MRDEHSNSSSRPRWNPSRIAAVLVAFGLIAVAYAGVGSFVEDKPSERVDLCANGACHVSIVDRKVKHGILQGLPTQQSCMKCHEYASVELHLFRLNAPKRDLCVSCHTLSHGPVVHTPVAEQDCTGCHDPHGSDHRLLLVEDPARGLCARCHDAGAYDKKFVHGPVAVGACVVCHTAHSSEYPDLLSSSADQLCLGCHDATQLSGPAARHKHKPMEDGCTSCHSPHASDHRYQLLQPSPELCFTCHEGIKQEMATASIVHGPAAGEGGCVGCHDPHGSALPRLQKAAQPGLCLACHDEPVKAQSGRMLKDMAAVLEDNPNHHGPIREGNCTTCHQPHAGDHFGLLTEQYPPEFYAPFESKQYALCFGCHLSDLVEDKSGTGLTGFRNGDLNLHWLHVNREKGRTCRACHEVHASNRPFHIRESVPFGTNGWMLEINYEQKPNGGSCAPGCHKGKDYLRDAPPAAPPTGQAS